MYRNNTVMPRDYYLSKVYDNICGTYYSVWGSRVLRCVTLGRPMVGVCLSEVSFTCSHLISLGENRMAGAVANVTGQQQRCAGCLAETDLP